MKKNGLKIRVINFMAVLLHIIRVILVNVAIIGIIGEAEGSLWPTQFIALGCAVAAIGAFYFIGKVINWLDKASYELIRK